jgi:hypothetical protein
MFNKIPFKCYLYWCVSLFDCGIGSRFDATGLAFGLTGLMEKCGTVFGSDGTD